jgi:hypothetical protein
MKMQTMLQWERPGPSLCLYSTRTGLTTQLRGLSGKVTVSDGLVESEHDSTWVLRRPSREEAERVQRQLLGSSGSAGQDMAVCRALPFCSWGCV